MSHRSDQNVISRRGRFILFAVILGALLLFAGAVFCLSVVRIGGRMVPVSTSRLDLSGAGLDDIAPLHRLTRLRHLDLSGNAISDVSPLYDLKRLDYVDLIGNPVSPQSYAELRHALPAAFILCEAEDNETTSLVLSNQGLPDFDTLLRVLKAHTVLQTLDARQTGFTDAQVDVLRAALPNVYVHADVAVGEDIVDSESPSVTVADTDMTAIWALLSRFDRLTDIALTGRAMTPDEVRSLLAAYPQARFDMDVLLCGAQLDLHEAHVDLTNATLAEGWMDDLQLLQDMTVLDLPPLAVEDYETIKARFPAVTVTAAIRVGETVLDSDAETLDLRNETLPADMASLTRILQTFDTLRAIALPEMTPETALAISQALPGVAVSYHWLGQDIDAALTAIDLRSAGALSVDTLTALMETAPTLKAVTLDATTPAARRALKAYPDIHFEYDYTILGQRASTDEAAALNFDRFRLGDLEALALKKPLSEAGSLSEVDMYNAQLSYTVMDELFDSHPDTFFGWTFDLVGGRWTVRTDVTAFSTLKYDQPPYFDEDSFIYLRYCKNLQGLDLGHNKVSDISWLRCFPHLKLLILADNRVSDLSVLRDLKELEYVELFINWISDLSPLTDLDALLDLNICFNSNWNHGTLEDIAPLMSLDSLDRLWISNCRLTDEQQRALTEALPDCQIVFKTTKGSTSDGWREHRRFYTIHECFTTREYRPFD